MDYIRGVRRRERVIIRKLSRYYRLPYIYSQCFFFPPSFTRLLIIARGNGRSENKRWRERGEEKKKKRKKTERNERVGRGGEEITLRRDTHRAMAVCLCVYRVCIIAIRCQFEESVCFDHNVNNAAMCVFIHARERAPPLSPLTCQPYAACARPILDIHIQGVPLLHGEGGRERKFSISRMRPPTVSRSCGYPRVTG